MAGNMDNLVVHSNFSLAHIKFFLWKNEVINQNNKTSVNSNVDELQLLSFDTALFSTQWRTITDRTKFKSES